MEKLARYVVRASFSHRRMTCIPEEFKVHYRSKDGKMENISDALVQRNPPALNMLCKVFPRNTTPDSHIVRPI